MQDDHFRQDLEAHLITDQYDALLEQGITTYTKLFALIRDETANTKLRTTACFVVSRLSSTVDKRRAVPPLLVAIHSADEALKQQAVIALSHLNTRRGTDALFALAADRNQTDNFRETVIHSLWNAPLTPHQIDGLLTWMFDPTESPHVRAQAIESSTYQPILKPIEVYIALLSDPQPDARFWAAYCLSQSCDNTTAALTALDKVVADDHILPTTWGWHIDREAMQPLETIFYNLIRGSAVDEDGKEYFRRPGMYLISPAPEYDSILREYRHQGQNGLYSTDPLPEIRLKIDPDWLANQLRIRWPETQLNIRQPHPQAYLLDWHLQVEDKHLIGALHRDQYGVVLSGDDGLIFAFAAWYRGLFPAEQHLYIYQWADVAIEIKLDMTAADIESASNSLDQR
ncbi:MAG: hypothetical protein K8L97_13385 [Anaerolineae bacterium]|nr:hypothetical protein [Anaerolineae bacterium]